MQGYYVIPALDTVRIRPLCGVSAAGLEVTPAPGETFLASVMRGFDVQSPAVLLCNAALLEKVSKHGGTCSQR